MTSKQALEKLNYECIHTNGVDDESHIEYNLIMKDLKLLEKIKEEYKECFVSCKTKNRSVLCVSNKFVELLKELENEN